MKKSILLSAFAMIISLASFALGAISGPVTVCAGNTVYLTDADTGGVWSTSDIAIAAVGAGSGAVTGVSAGTATITYTLGGSSVTASFTVNAVPDPISATSTSFCPGATATCTDATPGGTWSADYGGTLSISSLGVVTGASPGTAYIYYQVGGCWASLADTVLSTYTGTITGPYSVCLGSTSTYVDAGVSGGTWSTSDAVIASVNSTTGVVTGIALGTVAIIYTVPTGTCGPASTADTIYVSNTTYAGVIYGGGISIYSGTTALLSDYGGPTGGTWSTSDPSIASIDASTGAITGVSSGTVSVTYSVLGCGGLGYAYSSITVLPFSSHPLSGPAGGCSGSVYYFSDSTYAGGTWSTSDPTVATIDASGVVTALSAGTTTISYDYSGVYVTAPFTVSTAPAAISESSTYYCVGSTSICTDATTGGTWSTSNPYIATVSATGVVTGISNGVAAIYYTIGGSCSISIYDTVNATYAGYLVSPLPICVGSSLALSDSAIAPGGTWSSSTPSIATVDASGSVTGIAPGTDTIYYTVAGSCGSGYASAVVTISNTTDAGVIYGGPSVTVGSVISLSDYSSAPRYLSSGTWSSSDPSIASIDASGNVTGITSGTVTITYAADGCGGIADATTTITVTSLNGISGHVLFGGASYYGDVTVYLITYNPTTLDLEAVDSQVVFSSGTSAYYQFLGVATDSFRVKASVSSDSSYVTTGYVPTYHTSSCYWSSANVIYHTSGTSDINEDINMAYGTVVSGPGFIGGSVTSGADRGTSTAIPATGLLVFLVNAATNTLIEQTYTSATGTYSFSGLPIGTYYVYPEAINFGTTAYTGIAITSSTHTVSGANFIEHTLSHTITPVIEAVNNVVPSVSSVVTFPNPVSGDLNILWKETANEQGTLIIVDITGREVLKTTLDMVQGNGSSKIDMSSLVNGVYLVTLKSGNINYNTKIQVQH